MPSRLSEAEYAAIIRKLVDAGRLLLEQEDGR
jgi:hypothetical protein